MFVEAPSEPRRVSPEPTTPSIEPEPASDDPDREQAKRLFQEGVQLFEAGDFAGAVEKFEQAWVLEPVPQLVFNIARGREQLGDVEGACAAYLAIRNYPDADVRMRDEASKQRVNLNCP